MRASRHRSRQGPITVTWVPGTAGVPPRVAYAVGRRTGGAVVRNRLRRRLRAAARDADLAPGAYLISAAPVAADMTFGELRDSVRAAARALTAEVPPR